MPFFGRKKDDPSSFTILVDDTGLRSQDAKGATRWLIRWNDIEQICAYKIDVLVYDIICMGFLARGADQYLCCDEQQSGWDKLNDELERRLNINPIDWWEGVAHPAFARNFTVIWKRQLGKIDTL